MNASVFFKTLAAFTLTKAGLLAPEEVSKEDSW